MFSSPVGEPGLEGAKSAADALPVLSALHRDGAGNDHPGGQVAVAREVLGCAVDYQVRAQLERTLQTGGAEGVVYHERCAARARDLGNARGVGHAQEGVGDGFDDDGAGSSSATFFSTAPRS